ncbi:DsbA family protein [Pedobacter sp. MW01-1-1]|uniref:DsbA family protein n=1 Tax=Pedobacter sp. MW01-1-1 TaxID=3383027 RepID=UPI003FEF705B
MTKTNNPLLCDPVEGFCGIADNSGSEKIETSKTTKSIKVVYFTDPICSSCWGIEPQLRKLKLEYGNILDFEYRMGGLLPDWSYNSGGISKPADVAHHWDEVSAYYDMPIDGDVWLEDPLDSSYPPSIAFKAAQMQSEEKAILFLRAIREMVFLQKINIAKWENLKKAAETIQLDVAQFANDYNAGAKVLFEEDLALAKQYGVRGFPTLFFIGPDGQKEIVYGTKPYAYLENALSNVVPNAIKSIYSKNWENLFSTYPTLTAKEFSELSATPRAESEKLLNALVANGSLVIRSMKNGSIWMRKNI